VLLDLRKALFTEDLDKAKRALKKAASMNFENQEISNAIEEVCSFIFLPPY